VLLVIFAAQAIDQAVALSYLELAVTQTIARIHGARLAVVTFVFLSGAHAVYALFVDGARVTVVARFPNFARRQHARTFLAFLTRAALSA